MLPLIAKRSEACNSHYSDIELELGSEAPYRCLMADAGSQEADRSPRSPQRLDDFLAVLEEAPRPSTSRRWPCFVTTRERGDIGGRAPSWARGAVLTWRLQRPYLIYCLFCSLATLILLAWNLYKGMQNNWNLPQWKHHRWEEVLEVTLGACMVLETGLTLCVLGVRKFFSNGWCIFDFFVMLVTVVSMCYGIEHIGRNGEISEADVPLLCLRFISQPARVIAICMGVRRTREMQRVDELQVNFDALNGQSGFSLQPTGPTAR